MSQWIYYPLKAPLSSKLSVNNNLLSIGHRVEPVIPRLPLHILCMHVGCLVYTYDEVLRNNETEQNLSISTCASIQDRLEQNLVGLDLLH